MSFFRDYYGRASERFRVADPIVRIMTIAGLILAMSIAVPRFLPWVGSGVNCEQLPVANIGGNNQSWLAVQQAQSGASANSLLIEIVAGSQTIAVGEQLTIYVRFINDSMAPISLFLPRQPAIFRYNNEEIGVLIFLQNTQTGQQVGEFANTNPPVTPRQQYAADEVYSLQPRQRCTVRVDISPQRLQTAGAGQGQYRLVVVYRNTGRGALSPVTNQLTPTPVFADQGVWTGQSRSNELLINIGVQSGP